VGFVNYKTEITGLSFSFLVAIIFWRILIVPARFFIALMISIMFFLTYRYIVSEGKEVNCNSPSSRFKKISFSCLVVLSILSVLFVNPIGKEVDFIAWNAIRLPSILRLLLSSCLTLFSPGYMILNLIDRNAKLTGTEKVLFSIIISLFLIPFLGLLSFALGSNIQQLGIPSIILLNLTLLIPYILFDKDKFKASEKVSIDLNEKLILISLLVFMSVLMLSKYSLNLTWDYGDLDIYYGYSVSFTKDVLPLSPIGPGLDYPFWPFIFLAECFILSGVPYVNTFQFVSIPMTFLPILSFYIMLSAFFEGPRRRKIPIIGTIFGFFGGGFGWIFGIHLLFDGQTSQSLYELFEIMARTNSGYLIPSFYSAPGTTGIYPLYTYTLTSIFALIWLIYSKRTIKLGNLRYVFIPLMIALGYLAHIAEIVFSIFIFVASILIFERKNLSSYRKCAISIILGLILIALPDIIVKGSYYTGGDPFTYYGFSLYYIAFVLAVLTFFLSFIKDRLKTRAVSLKIIRNKIGALKIAFSSLILYFYGLSLIIWSKVFGTYNRLPTQMHAVPWYAWSNRLGICGLIALFGAIYLIHKNKNIKAYSFFILLIPVSFIISRVLHVYPFYMEDRLTFFIMIPTVILASCVLLKFGQSLKKHGPSNIQNVIFGFVLSMVLVLGFLPNLLTGEAVDFNYWSKGEKMSNQELDALNFLRLNTPSNGSVLTLTTRSKRLLSYSGLFPLQTYVNRDSSLIFMPSFTETAISSLAKSQLKYLYFASADEKELEQNPSYSGFVRDCLLKYLPIAFQNEEVTIYEVLDFSAPTNSSTALVTSNLRTGYFKDVFDESYEKFCRFSSVLTTGNIITVKTDNQSGNHDFEIPVNINPDESPYVTVRWKTDGSKLYLYLLSSKTVYYTSLGRSKSWETTVINLHDFYDCVREKTMSVNPSEPINSILFRNFELNSEYAIDYIQFVGFPNNDAVGGFFPLSTVDLSQIEYSTVLEDDPARFNYSALILTHDLNIWSETEEQDFQKYLQWTDQGGRLIVLESLGAHLSYEYRNLTKSEYIGWRDEDFTTGWTTYDCSALSNGSIVTVETNDKEIYHDFYLNTINVSVHSYPYVVIRWKTDGSPLLFYPHGTQSDYRYITLGASTEWTTNSINLKEFYDIVLKNITSFEDDEQIDNLTFRSFTENATYSIDYVKFYKEYPLPLYPGFADLLSIYTESTLEAEGVESQTGGLHFPSVITVPVIHSIDTNTKIVANYTLNGKPVSPYAITKKIGKGEVIYLAVSPYFSVIENSTGDINRDFFRDIGSLLDVLNLELDKNIVKRINYFPQFDYIKEPANFTGKVSVDTDYIQLPRLNVNYIKILSNDGKMETTNLTHSMIEAIEYAYPVKFRINAFEVHLSRIGLGKYLKIEIVGDFRLTMELPKNGIVKMSIWNGTMLLNKTFQEVTIQLNIENNDKSSVSVKNPTITTEGDAFFNRARIYRNHYKMPLFYNDGTNPFEVIGKTTFKIEYSDNGIIFVDGFIFNGKWFYPTTEQKQSSFTEMDIPWFNILTSPLHILLVTVICAFSIAYTYITLKRVKIRIKLKLR